VLGVGLFELVNASRDFLYSAMSLLFTKNGCSDDAVVRLLP
jgi:hypothetical protein